MGQNAILTRDNMKKRFWPGNPCCSFYNQLEPPSHLLFLCPVSTVVWRTVWALLGTDSCPNSIWQYYTWIYSFLPGFEKIYTVGLAAICWAIWLARKRATLECKWINSPFEIVFTACAFLMYWAGLQKPELEEIVKKGAEMLKENTTHMILLCGPPAPNIDGRDWSWRWMTVCARHRLLGYAAGALHLERCFSSFW